MGDDSVLQEYLAKTAKSRALYERARYCLPGGNSRSTIFFNPYPPYVVRGQGCRIWDVDGTERIDFLNNYTSLILGHAHPRVVDAVTRQAQNGTAFASPTELEVRLAEIIGERVPSVERMRFTNSGTEATMFALRAARAFTGREKIAKFEGGFHGTHEHASVSVHPAPDAAGPSQSPRAVPDGPGIPGRVVEGVVILPFNDPAGVEEVLARHGQEIAAVIAEPVMGAAGIIPPKNGFLGSLREVTRRHGILLILDEIICFRLSYRGAQGYYGLTPDLTTFGKIIGGGLPVGGFGGRADIMEQFDPRRPGRIGHGGTFNANPMTMAAGIATLEALTPEVFDRLEAMAKELAERLRALFGRRNVPGRVTQVGSLFNIHFTRDEVWDFRGAQTFDANFLQRVYLGLLNHGVFLAPRGMACLSTPMGQAELDAFLSAMDAALTAV